VPSGIRASGGGGEVGQGAPLRGHQSANGRSSHGGDGGFLARVRWCELGGLDVRKFRWLVFFAHRYLYTWAAAACELEFQDRTPLDASGSLCNYCWWVWRVLSSSRAWRISCEVVEDAKSETRLVHFGKMLKFR
jgi:hypothetical protein